MRPVTRLSVYLVCVTASPRIDVTTNIHIAYLLWQFYQIRPTEALLTFTFSSSSSSAHAHTYSCAYTDREE